jgi:hypothetical protein
MESREGAEFRGLGIAEEFQSGDDGLVHIGVDGDALGFAEAGDKLGRPGHIGGCFEVAEGLEGEASGTRLDIGTSGRHNDGAGSHAATYETAQSAP